MYYRKKLLFKFDLTCLKTFDQLNSKVKSYLKNQNILLCYKEKYFDDSDKIEEHFKFNDLKKGIDFTAICFRRFEIINEENKIDLTLNEEDPVYFIKEKIDSIAEKQNKSKITFALQYNDEYIERKKEKIYDYFKDNIEETVKIIMKSLENIDFLDLNDKLLMKEDFADQEDMSNVFKRFQEKIRESIDENFKNHIFLVLKGNCLLAGKHLKKMVYLEKSNIKMCELKRIHSIADLKIYVAEKKKIKYLLPFNENKFDAIPQLTVFENKILLSESKKINIESNKQIWMQEKYGSYKEMKDEILLDNYLDDNMPSISVSFKVDINICYDQVYQLKDISTQEQIGTLKEVLSKEIHIPKNQQKWFFEDDELEDEKTLIDFIKDHKIFERIFNESSKITDTSSELLIPINLVLASTFEFYGFTFGKTNLEENINYQDFYFEHSELLENLIDKTYFAQKQDEYLFRKEMVQLFYNRLKKQSLWEDLVYKIRKLMNDKKEDICLWKSQFKRQESLFNNTFILHNLLLSSNKASRFKLLNTAQRYLPIPLFLNEWSENFLISQQNFVNELYWITNQSFVICSFGIGRMSQENMGKSALLNTFFFTNFSENCSKHPVCQNVPEMRTNIYYNDHIPINLIDIPSKFDEKELLKIICHSNLLIIHCHHEEKKFLNDYLEMKEIFDVPKCVFLRDNEGFFDKTKEFKSKILKSFNDSKTTNKFILDIDNLKLLKIKEYQEKIDFIIKHLHEILYKYFTSEKKNNLWKFHSYIEEKISESIPKKTIFQLLNSLDSNNENLTKTVPIHSQYIKLLRNLDLSKIQNQIEEKENELKNCQTSNEILEIYKLLSNENLPIMLFFNKISNFLRKLMLKKTKKMYEIYEYKNKLAKDSSTEIIEAFSKYWDVIKHLSLFFEKEKLPEQSHEFEQFLTKIIRIFEKQILPNILSSELIWRELIYMASYQQENITDNQVSFSDQLSEIYKNYIYDGNPFEIIDGDSLYMPKDFLKKVFKGKKESVLIISVLGPQSSGKSTLLNFLFGCDFMTSTGRCTKGIYGTYIKSTNFTAYDSILILDTEGLLAIMGSAEKEERTMFDRRVCLFALAVSDFVFINTRGDFDAAMNDILYVCMNSLFKLKKGNINMAELYVILNQNQDTKIENHLLYIDKVFSDLTKNLEEISEEQELALKNISSKEEKKENENISTKKKKSLDIINLDKENVEVLPTAYDDKVYGKDKVPSLEEKILIRTPKEEFFEKTSAFCQKILTRAKQKVGVSSNIEDAIENMEKTWEMISKYPDLIKPIDVSAYKKAKQLDQYMYDVINSLSKLRNDFFNEIPDFDKVLMGDQDFLEQTIRTHWKTKEDKIINEFQKDFEEKNFDSQLIENFLNTKLRSSFNSFFSELMSIALQTSYAKKIEENSLYGEERIKYLINQTLRESEKEITKEEKEEKFNKVWNQIIKEVDGKKNKTTEALNLFNHLKTFYQIYINILGYDLPITSQLTYEKISNLDEPFCENLINTFRKIDFEYFEYTKQIPAMVLKGGQTNVTFNYFDIRKYFKLDYHTTVFCVSKWDLEAAFNFDKVWFEIQRNSQKEKVLEILFSKISSQFGNIGFEITFQVFKDIINYKDICRAHCLFISDPTSRSYECSFINDINDMRTQSLFNVWQAYCNSNGDENQNSYFDKNAMKSFMKNNSNFTGLTTSFIKINCLRYFIDWKKIYKEYLEEIDNDLNLKKIKKKIKLELEKLNLRLPKKLLKKKIRGQKRQNFFDDIEIIKKAYSKLPSLDELLQQNFEYFDLKNINGTKCNPETNYIGNFKIAIEKMEVIRLKEEYKDIKYLEYHAKNDSKKLFQDTFQ